jgi:hypothetical protein
MSDFEVVTGVIIGFSVIGAMVLAINFVYWTLCERQIRKCLKEAKNSLKTNEHFSRFENRGKESHNPDTYIHDIGRFDIGAEDCTNTDSSDTSSDCSDTSDSTTTDN